MPSLLSSPPLARHSRSSPGPRYSTTFTPPIPSRDSPVPSASSMPSHRITTPSSTPRQRVVPPMPPVPASPATRNVDSLPPPSPRTSISRSSSSSSSSSSPRVTTPPPRNRSRSGNKLLPALPLSVNTQLVPSLRNKRGAVAYAGEDESGGEAVQIVISREGREGRLSLGDIPSPRSPLRSHRSPRSPPIRSRTCSSNGTPPRPARRSSARRGEYIPSPTAAEYSTDLLLPQLPYLRSHSPSGDSISTISDAATTPRAAQATERPEASAPSSSLALGSFGESSSAPLRKRDSAQRRLSALRGLVANLDFNQPWSLTEPTDEEEVVADDMIFWACSAPVPPPPVTPQKTSTPSPSPISPPPEISTPIPLVHDISPFRPRLRRNINAAPAHHFPMDQPVASPPVPELHSLDSFSRIETTPLKRTGSGRKPNSTPPRRPRQSRSSSDLLSRTPDPPRPSSRHRREVFEVASSGYSKCHEPTSPGVTSTPTTIWRSSLPNDEVYQRMLIQHGPSEIKRQEIIWEMCETEQAFVKSMRTVLRLFAIPLKTPQGKWIQGIPARITELFDSLECVAHAHGIVSATQRDMRQRSEVLDVGAFIASLKEWVPRLEVHEWYLLRFEHVVQLVEDNVRDPDSVFGEFVRMQMKEEVLGSMSLGSMLLKPVQRLTKYPLFLRRLLDVTPHPHPCHPEILSLLSMTESIILNLQATKAREEDYEQLQTLESRIHGLPDGFVLAVRGRKLLGSGSVVRVLPHKDLSQAQTSRNRADSLHSSRGSISSSVSGYSSPWDFYGGLTPSTCRTSAFSVSSSASSYCPPSRTSSIVQTSPQRPSVSRSPSSAWSVVNDSRPSTPSTSSLRGRRKHEEVLTMLVFNDLVVIATEASEKQGLFAPKRKVERGLRVLQEMEGGVGKVIEVKDWSGWQGYGQLFTITMLPLGSSPANHLGPCTTAFTLPPQGSPNRPSKAISSCPQLTSLASLIAVLGQTTSLPGLMGEEGEGKEMLSSTEHLVM